MPSTMITLISNSSNTIPIDAMKILLPASIGLASAAYLAWKITARSGYSADKSIPTVPFQPGSVSHDAEFQADQDGFLLRCEAKFGPTFNIAVMNKAFTVVSGAQIQEVFMNEDFSGGDAFNEFTGMRVFMNSIRKSNTDLDNPIMNILVSENITPNLASLTPGIAQQLEMVMERELKAAPRSMGAAGNVLVIDNPIIFTQEMVASAMAIVFMGPEATTSRKLIDAFIASAIDFRTMLGNGIRRASFWRLLIERTNYRVINPLQAHVRTLVEFVNPIVVERRRQEAAAVEQGVSWQRPDDILQGLLDNFDKYNFVDLEDICGHLLILILAGVHSTADTSACVLYFMAAYPQYMEKLFEEQEKVLKDVQKEREQERQNLRQKGEPIGEDLDPAHDRDLSLSTMKRMVYMDSFVRETFRYRTERLKLMHRARKDVTLSNGMTITKGSSVIMNVRSVHQAPDQGEDVTEFRPWRFVGKAKAATKAGLDFLPFGMGKHACPGRFLAIQNLKTIGVLVVSRFSKIEMQDPSKAMRILRSRMGTPTMTGLLLTERQ